MLSNIVVEEVMCWVEKEFDAILFYYQIVERSSSRTRVKTTLHFLPILHFLLLSPRRTSDLKYLSSVTPQSNDVLEFVET